jgi:hypothetical protein
MTPRTGTGSSTIPVRPAPSSGQAHISAPTVAAKTLELPGSRSIPAILYTKYIQRRQVNNHACLATIPAPCPSLRSGNLPTTLFVSLHTHTHTHIAESGLVVATASCANMISKSQGRSNPLLILPCNVNLQPAPSSFASRLLLHFLRSTTNFV